MTGKIAVLPEDVVTRIAAGEVVDRPASVVKELIENSLDAGAGRIEVEVEGGGLQTIRVTDDGEGIVREDVPRAFLRHATSKIRSAEELRRVATLGFRGEALPAVLSVARVRLRTATAGEPEGTEIRGEGGRLGEATAAPPVRGTIVEVSDLFYNTPARRKFLRSAASEFSQVAETVREHALARPDVAFRLSHHGRSVITCPRASDYMKRLGDLYPDLVSGLIRLEEDGEGLIRFAAVSRPGVYHRARSYQRLYLDRRPIRNALLMHAVYDAYDTLLPKGVHPAVILMLDAAREEVDVNVHPAKREVRFADPVRVRENIRRAVRRTLGAQPLVGPQRDTDLGSTAGETAAGYGFSVTARRVVEPKASNMVDPKASNIEDAPAARTGSFSGPGPDLSLPLERVVRSLAQVAGTYIVALVDEELCLIDQHAAHERVVYERLVRAPAPEAAALVVAAPITPPPREASLAQGYLEEIRGLGLDLEPFGGDSFLVRSVPSGVQSEAVEALLLDLIADLEEGGRDGIENVRARMLSTIACHAAIRAGRSLSIPEMDILVKDLMNAEMPFTCPHGRPTLIRWDLARLEQLFGRR